MPRPPPRSEWPSPRSPASGAIPSSAPFGDGPTEGVIVDLARFRRLSVLLPASSPYRESVDSKRVGRSAEAEPRFSVAEHNLPQQVTALVGRAAELAEIKARLDQHRLVTLVGSGGVGKTRLALQAAADLLERYPDGVWLVELAPLANPQLVAETVAGVFGVSRSTGRSAVEIVVASLKEKRTLLLLDNCEHLVDAVAQVAEAILRGCPTVSVLASSRENLAIAGENVYRVPSLDFPEDAEGITAAAALDHAAVRLFADRAGSVVDGFAVTDANAPAIAAICRRLDGVALAIELAVARLRMLKPQELASRLDDRFRLLTGGSRTALPRQQTLKAMIDWSYDLLTDPERTLLRRLSVFAGGWTLDSAATVCAGDPVEEREIFDLLASLIDKSLVVADATGDRTRYRLLESTRAYALEKLVESGERGHRRRLAEHVMALFSEAEASWATMATKAWLRSYAPELDNLRAALEWAFGPVGDIALGLDLTGRSLPLFLELSLLPEQKRWFDAAVERIGTGTPPATAARLWLGSSFTHRMYYRDPLGAEAASRAAAFYREAGDALGLGAALVRAGAALLTPGDTAAGERLLREAQDLLRPLGRTKHLAACLNAMSVARHLRRRHPGLPRRPHRGRGDLPGSRRPRRAARHPEQPRRGGIRERRRGTGREPGAGRRRRGPGRQQPLGLGRDAGQPGQLPRRPRLAGGGASGGQGGLAHGAVSGPRGVDYGRDRDLGAARGGRWAGGASGPSARLQRRRLRGTRGRAASDRARHLRPPLRGARRGAARGHA